MTLALYLLGRDADQVAEAFLAGYRQGRPQRVRGGLWALPLEEGGVPCGLRLRGGHLAVPDACLWARDAPLPERVLGDRLGLAQPEFLATLAQRSRLLVVHLVDGDRRAERIADTCRGVGITVEDLPGRVPAPWLAAEVRDLAAGWGMEPRRHGEAGWRPLG